VSAEATDECTETARLRARVAALEAELLALQEWANDVVADAQEKTYWLERWHVDLNSLMRRRGAERARAIARAVRAVFRAGRRARRRWRA
jgi:hypothetical protein